MCDMPLLVELLLPIWLYKNRILQFRDPVSFTNKSDKKPLSCIYFLWFCGGPTTPKSGYHSCIRSFLYSTEPKVNIGNSAFQFCVCVILNFSTTCKVTFTKLSYSNILSNHVPLVNKRYLNGFCHYQNTVRWMTRHFCDSMESFDLKYPSDQTPVKELVWIVRTSYSLLSDTNLIFFCRVLSFLDLQNLVSVSYFLGCSG